MKQEKLEGAHKILAGNPEGKTLVGRSRRRWEDNC
jgi:hypothetical protein